MIGYRFKTEEEMIASLGPNWRTYPRHCEIDDQCLGKPFSSRFIQDCIGKFGPVSFNVGYLPALSYDIVAKIDYNIFDLKDRELGLELSKSIISFKWKSASGDKVGHPILYDWITPFYVDTEAHAKISVQKNKLTFKLPGNI